MAINPSGAVQLGGSTSGQSIALEVGVPATGTISLNDAAVRSMIGAPTGQITMNDAHGKSGATKYSLTVASPVQNYNVYTALTGAGWPGTTPADVTVTINSGVYVWSDSTTAAALDTGTPWPALSRVQLVNNGYIMGRGGDGGYYSTAAPVGNGSGGTGGPAISLNVPMILDNTNGFIGGGGGGGSYSYLGGYAPANPAPLVAYGAGGGGGAGGGRGASQYSNPTSPNAPTTQAAGGAIGSSGSSFPQPGSPTIMCGGGGGRIWSPTMTQGSGASLTGNPVVTYGSGLGGQGGGGGAALISAPAGGSATGGTGGTTLAGGTASCTVTTSPNPAKQLAMAAGGGGGWGASGGAGTDAYFGTNNRTTSNYGSGGSGIALNGKTVSYPSPTAQGTIYGPIA